MKFAFSNSRAPRTTELYRCVWTDFTQFCKQIDASALPALPETVLEFLRAREPTHSNSALSARKSAIIAAHKDARMRLPKDQREPYLLEHDDMLKLGWQEISRRKGNRHTPRKALTAAQLEEIVTKAIDLNSLIGVMDRAIFLVSWAILMRRSEVAALNVDDIEFKDGLMFVYIRRSKTDQAGEGKQLPAAPTGDVLCPIAAMKEWIKQAGITEGPLFQHPKFNERRRISVSYPYWAIKKYVSMIGEDPAPYGHHSFRRGGITHINDLGVDRKNGMEQSRHKSPAVYEGYIASKEAAKNPAIYALARRLPSEAAP